MSDRQEGFFMADALVLLMLCLMQRMDAYVVDAILSY